MANYKSGKLVGSLKLAVKVVYNAMQILKEKGGEAPGREIIDELEKKLHFNDWEKATYEKSGYIRWQSILHFYSIDCVKAGFLLKKKGIWYLTPEGEEALKLGDIEFMQKANDGYYEWKTKRDATVVEREEIESPDEAEITIEADLDQVEQKATEMLFEYIRAKNPYEFQDLVAALLRAMGYYTPFVAPKGKDGGIDIIAYIDPLGTKTPRMKVQVKHRQNATSVDEIRQLSGILSGSGDVGIFFSSGGFTSDAKNAAMNSPTHIELVDLPGFVTLWQQFYDKMTDEDKNLLPMLPIYFLKPQN